MYVSIRRISGSLSCGSISLETDIEVYNDKRNPAEPIQIPRDFTRGVAELQMPHSKAT
ncbi:hypothetical protein [Arenimonas sp. SCN 70-307]|uniref:hypothetical protein n=1 Tax=Arenimonas sp. SCN 70-307 TaxID=1660089 RepID=UPI0025C46788|nr:hypothetical protein [Arenimonas sp. SCN 70-307]